MTGNAKPIYRTGEIRRIEGYASAQPLMARAGLAAAQLARELLAEGGTVLILAGPGNNGGDALVVATHLKQWWFNVTVVFTGNAKKLPEDAANAMRAWLAAGGRAVKDLPPNKRWDLVIDGLFGIGLTRDLDASYADLIRRVAALKLPVMAIDIPSGLDSDTGQVRGVALRADHTVTFIALKPGLLTSSGLDYCGKVHVDTIGLEPAAITPPNGWVLDADLVKNTLNPRPRDSHKGQFGSVGIIGGAPGMHGAALLAGRAALKLGAGRVYVSMLDCAAPRVDGVQPELMLRPAEAVLKLSHLHALVLGPGLGQSTDAVACLEYALQRALPLLLDADALNLIGADSNLQQKLRTRASPSIITPHPAEAARLLDSTAREVQNDRLTAAIKLARSFNSITVLKGAGSICALPDGKYYINSSGNPGLSSGGTGDVLSGMIGALLAQGVEAQQALLTGVYLQGAAADDLVARGIGPVGLTASELIDCARSLLNNWIAER